MPDKSQLGLYNKFNVTRTDGTDQNPGDKHYGCAYFVLDLDHDPHARTAIAAYRDSCRVRYPVLADELNEELMNRRFGQ